MKVTLTLEPEMKDAATKNAGMKRNPGSFEWNIPEHDIDARLFDEPKQPAARRAVAQWLVKHLTEDPAYEENKNPNQ